MRLIDADVLLEYLEKNEVKFSIDEINKGNETYSATLLYNFVKNQPTAYDVDKVVEQLEDKVKEYDERIEKRKGPTFFDETERIKQFDERAWGIEIAIEIVRVVE